MADLVSVEPAGPDPSIIETLEDALAQARAGNLSAVAVAEVYRDGRIGARWSASPRTSMLIGAIARLSHRFHIAADER